MREKAPRNRLHCALGPHRVCVRNRRCQHVRGPGYATQAERGLQNARSQSLSIRGVERRVDSPARTAAPTPFNYTGKTSKNVIVSGVYTISGRQITFKDHSAACSAKPGTGGCRDLACRKPGTYTFELTGKKLGFTRLRDPNTNCELPVVLASAFHRVN